MDNIRLKDYIKDIDPRGERRYFAEPMEYRAQDEKNIIEGYAAVFNRNSEDFGGWVEQIAPGAFSERLKDDTVALFNHSMNLVLGRNGVNLTLSEDNIGLRYRVELPDTSLGRDIYVLAKSQILQKSSFAFTVKEERFIKANEKSGEPAMRIIDKVERLYDVSPVTMPAYPDSSVGARSFQKFSEEVNKELEQKNAKDQIQEALKLMNKPGYMGMKIRKRKKAFSTDKYSF